MYPKKKIPVGSVQCEIYLYLYCVSVLGYLYLYVFTICCKM
jgi:hypothetical protein